MKFKNERSRGTIFAIIWYEKWQNAIIWYEKRDHLVQCGKLPPPSAIIWYGKTRSSGMKNSKNAIMWYDFYDHLVRQTCIALYSFPLLNLYQCCGKEKKLTE